MDAQAAAGWIIFTVILLLGIAIGIGIGLWLG